MKQLFRHMNIQWYGLETFFWISNLYKRKEIKMSEKDQYNKEYYKKYYQKNKKKKIAQAKRNTQIARKRNVELVSSYKREKGVSFIPV